MTLASESLQSWRIHDIALGKWTACTTHNREARQDAFVLVLEAVLGFVPSHEIAEYILEEPA